ncbi:MAG TPA: PPK2 family polyphosphate kinase [Sporichthyaceae bacterium]|jgi:PPK2 family polyphosphate:nucleotide phosphotransferase|nr:PPK2 family polyphosphate kinase [Sporichthyaceae bacterium]
MSLGRLVVEELAVAPGKSARLDERRTDRITADWLTVSAGQTEKQAATARLDDFRSTLAALQEVLHAEGTRALLLIFQGLDAAGKDGTISHVLGGVNPQGLRVDSFKQPSAEELRHDFLWRAVLVLPERGQIAVFNRSYYEDVLVVRVHPELLDPPPARGHESRLWTTRFEDINSFERHLAHSGTTIVKFFLHVSAAEQRRRLLERLADPSKYWKFSPADLAEREHFDAYRLAYAEALAATSTAHAPWYVIPADDKALMRALVAGLVVHALETMNLVIPEPDPAHRAALEVARQRLLAEPGN